MLILLLKEGTTILLDHLITVQHNGRKKTKAGLVFSKSSLKTIINHLIENWFFDVGNGTKKQAFGIPMVIDLAPFRINLFSYFYEEQYIPSVKIKARNFHLTKSFIDELCAINDGGEFERSICDIIQKNLFDKRDSFPFSIARIPHLESNIPQNTFYSAIDSEFLKIARLTLCIRDFIPKVKGLLERMYFFKKDNISSSREFPILLYLMAGLPNFFLRR